MFVKVKIGIMEIIHLINLITLYIVIIGNIGKQNKHIINGSLTTRSRTLKKEIITQLFTRVII